MTSTPPRPEALRECRLYRFWITHPVTGKRVLGYIGETGRLPFERLMEHVMSQPWADTILAWEVDPVTYWGKQAVLVAERAAIEAERPIYNYRENLSNPQRVEIWRAKEQRWARDDRLGRPRWVDPVKGGRRPAAAPVADHRRTSAPKWTPWQVKAGLWSAGWVLMSVATWAGLRRWEALVPELSTSATTVLTASTVIYLLTLGWALAGCPHNRRQWRALRRKAWKRVRR